MKRRLLLGLMLLALVAMFSASCTTSSEPNKPAVKDAAEARQAAITYLKEKALTEAPNLNTKWQESDETPPGLLGAANIYFTSDEWAASVSYPIVHPDLTVYRVVLISTKLGWHWEGEVKADGTVTEISAFQKMTDTASQVVAEDYVMNSPTYLFDGIEGSFRLIETIILRCPYCWQFVFEFESAHAGYGDRTDQILAEVITPHVAVITVDHMKVTGAIMDEKWDMIQQQMIGDEPPPSGVPAAPNDSIVTARVINIIRLEGEMPWEIIVEIQSSEDVPGFNNATRSKVGETVTLNTDEDASKLKKDQVITAHVQLKGDEHNSFYLAQGITVSE